MKTQIGFAVLLSAIAVSLASCTEVHNETPTTSSTTASSTATLTTASNAPETTAPETSDTSSPVSSESPSTTAPTTPGASLTIPDVTGQNAQAAKDALLSLGFTDVALTSGDPNSAVVLPQDWKVTSVNPPPGTAVKPDAPVVLNVTK